VSHPIVTLVGMSGVGKSYQAERLALAGWAHHDCDAAIAARLSSLVTPVAGEAPVIALGRWMGMPYADGHFDRERRYLELEQQATSEALDRAEASQHERPQLIDTTGSVLYLERALLDRLRRASRVVYLRTPPEAHAEMRARYLGEPKPVIWGSAWAPRDGERDEDALARCYSDLLAERDARYLALAHVVVDGRGLWEGASVDLATLVAESS
jgi:shikimate kinase